VIELTLRIIFSLLVVLGLMWGLAKLVRRPLAGRRGGLLSVVARQQLTRGSSIAIVQVAGKALVLGVTDQQVTLLIEADPSTLDTPAASEQLDITKLNAALRNPPAPNVPLSGSLLSPDTWSRTWTFLRSRKRSN
jgi:flagellar protein FliO/FliZ